VTSEAVAVNVIEGLLIHVVVQDDEEEVNVQELDWGSHRVAYRLLSLLIDANGSFEVGGTVKSEIQEMLRIV